MISLNAWIGYKIKYKMTKFKIILFIIATLISISRIIWKYMKEKQNPSVYDLLWPLLFLWLTIKNVDKL